MLVLAATAAALAGCRSADTDPRGLSGSELVVEGFGDTTAEDQAGLCEGVQLMGADFAIEALLSEDGTVASEVAEADPEELATALADFCADLATTATE